MSTEPLSSGTAEGDLQLSFVRLAHVLMLLFYAACALLTLPKHFHNLKTTSLPGNNTDSLTHTFPKFLTLFAQGVFVCNSRENNTALSAPYWLSCSAHKAQPSSNAALARARQECALRGPGRVPSCGLAAPVQCSNVDSLSGRRMYAATTCNVFLEYHGATQHNKRSSPRENWCVIIYFLPSYFKASGTYFSLPGPKKRYFLQHRPNRFWRWCDDYNPHYGLLKTRFQNNSDVYTCALIA